MRALHLFSKKLAIVAFLSDHAPAKGGLPLATDYLQNVNFLNVLGHINLHSDKPLQLLSC